MAAAAALDPFAGSPRGPLRPVTRTAGVSVAGVVLQACATAATVGYLKLRFDTTLASSEGRSSPVAVALFAAEVLAAFRALCHHGPFNLKSREEYASTHDLLATNSYQGCHMRILIPCYCESLDLVSATAIAAAAADLPAGMHRTIYLCDDGADPRKKRWCDGRTRDHTLGCDVIWVSGRSKLVPGNGKSLNLNHALRSIYGAAAVAPDCGRGVPSPGWMDVPDTEFIAGLDADMAPSPAFFTELVSKLRTPRDAIAQAAQAFWNCDPEADVTDNAQLVKYEICDSQVRAGGGVRCNGSGWVCRARAMAHSGWWRVDTTGEGQAMGIALERLGYRGYYSMKTLQVGEAPCTLGDTFVQKTRYAQNFWKNVFGRGGIVYDSTLSFGKRLTGQGLLRDSLTPLYVPVMIAVPVLGLLLPTRASIPSHVVGWSRRLPWAWLAQYVLSQAVVLFHVAGTALAPQRQRKQKACVRSLAASWLTNLTSTHAFWLATAVAAYNVFRAEIKGSLLEFVVTPKTQGAREGDHGAAALLAGSPVTHRVGDARGVVGRHAGRRAPGVADPSLCRRGSPGGDDSPGVSVSAPSVTDLPGVAASIAARPALYPDHYHNDGRRKTLVPRASALARRLRFVLAGAASRSRARQRTSIGLRMRRASIKRTEQLVRARLMHIKGAASGEKHQSCTDAAHTNCTDAACTICTNAACTICTDAAHTNCTNAACTICTDAPAPVPLQSPFANADASAHGHDKGGATDVADQIAAVFAGGGADWRTVLHSRTALHAEAKKLRRWTSSLRVARKPTYGRFEGVDAAVEDGATVADEEEGEAIPWEHLWVHALGGGLSLLACAAGLAKTMLAPSPQLVVFTAWAFVNSVPPGLLFVRALKGDGPTLKRWCAAAPRAVCVVATAALAGVVVASALQ